MSTPSWQRIFAIFEEAVELPPDERSAFLDGACGGAGDVRRGVEELLDAEKRSNTLLDRSPVQRPAASGDAAPPPDSASEAASAEPPSPADGPRWDLGAYRLLRRIGQGGMSTVFLAVRSDDAFKRQVVVKLVRRGMESASILRRLRTERQILASLDHPYVARLYDGGSSADGLPYFVMEYVDGVPIDAYCEHNQLTLGERLTLFRKVCAAVHYAHQNLVVHRDIKPSNILVTAGGDPKLLDFGIAKLLNPDLASAESEPTATWQRVLTPSYASPEQVRGKHVTTASDVYSLGVLLYKLLTGRLPRSFQGRSQREIEQLLTDTDPLPPSAAAALTGDGGRPAEQALRAGRQLSGDLDAIVLKALRSAPLQRYSSVERLAEDVERHQTGLPVAARAGGWRYRAGKFVRRNRTAVAVAAAVAAVLVVFAAAMAWQSARVARERDQARLERDGKQAVLGLILDVFELSDPYVLPGEELTVREALARSVPVLESGLREQPDVRAELLFTSGSILTVLGAYQPAAEQLAEALALRRELHGDRHVAVVDSLRALAAARKELGELDEAEELAGRAVELARGLPGAPGTTLAAALGELVSVRCYRSEYDAAEAPAREVLELARALPAADMHGTAALQALGLVHSARGAYRDAAELYRQALARLRKRYGERHPILIGVLSNLGLALRRQEEYEAAENVYLELLDLQRQNFGDDYRDPVSFSNLAGLRLGRGDYSGAEEAYRQALAAIVDAAGREHWMVFVFELGIAQAWIGQGRAADAEGRLRLLLDAWRPAFGDDHWRIVKGEGVLGASVSVQGRCREAEDLLVDSYLELLASGRHRHKEDALERLRDHLERCGRRQEIARFEAMLSAEAG